MSTQQSPEEQEVAAVLEELDHPGGIKRYEEYLKYYIEESYNEGTWPETWDEFKYDFALAVVHIRMVGGSIDLSEGAVLGDAGNSE
jgi:hypothetical protein